SAPNLALGATGNASITATGASAITVDSGTSASVVNLTISVPLGASSTLATTGGTISIAPTGTLTFVEPLSPTTLNLNGGPVTISAASLSVNSGVTLSSNNKILVSAPVISLFDNTTIFSTLTQGTSIIRLAYPGMTVNVQGTTNLLTGDGTPNGNTRIELIMATASAIVDGQTLMLQSVDQTGTTSRNVPTINTKSTTFLNTPNGTLWDNYVGVTTSAPRAGPLSGAALGNTLTIRGGGTAAGNGSLTLKGTPGPITATNSTGHPIILLDFQGANSSLNVTSSYTFNAGPSGEVDLVKRTNEVTGGINILDGVTVTVNGASTMRIIAPSLNLGNNSSLVNTAGASVIGS